MIPTLSKTDIGKTELTPRDHIYQADSKKRMEILEKEKYKTTKIYREINDNKSPKTILQYLLLNGSRCWPIRCIFSLRTGANSTEANQFIRHLTENPECRHCGYQYADERHIIEECPKFEIQRQQLKDQINKKISTKIQNLTLTQIVLYSNNYETMIKTENQETQIKLDNYIKDYIITICQRAHISERLF